MCGSRLYLNIIKLIERSYYEVRAASVENEREKENGRIQLA